MGKLRIAVRVAGVACCGVVESGERAAFEVDMACGSYSEAVRSELPQLAADASPGCGNPVALATLSPGEVVLDLGSGGGIDVLLSSARRVAPGGRAYGLDMTDEVLELARRNQANVENAEFYEECLRAVRNVRDEIRARIEGELAKREV